MKKPKPFNIYRGSFHYGTRASSLQFVSKVTRAYVSTYRVDIEQIDPLHLERYKINSHVKPYRYTLEEWNACEPKLVPSRPFYCIETESR